MPQVSTAPQELEIISSDITAAVECGGHAIRVLIAYTYLITLWFKGAYGKHGRRLSRHSGFHRALTVFSPSIIGGFGGPGLTKLFSNISGHTDVEKLDTLRCHERFLSSMNEDIGMRYKNYCIEKMTEPVPLDGANAASRLNFRTNVQSRLSSNSFDQAIYKAVSDRAIGNEAVMMFSQAKVSTAEDFPSTVIKAITEIDCEPVIPYATANDIFGGALNENIRGLVAKISSTRLVNDFLPMKVIRTFQRKFSSKAATAAGVIANSC